MGGKNVLFGVYQSGISLLMTPEAVVFLIALVLATSLSTPCMILIRMTPAYTLLPCYLLATAGLDACFMCAGLFHAALTWMQDEWYQDYEECECLVCNLICRNYIKGYVSHNQGVVVLSKQNPYPGVEQITLADPL